MTRYLGIDLAWGEGSASRRPNETGLALLDSEGRILDAGWAIGIAEVAGWIVANAVDGDVIAIDAPLVLPNPTGMRRGERQVGMGYGRWHVSANASNQAMGWKGGRTLTALLEESGLDRIDGLRPADASRRSFFECYPYTTLVGVAELGYNDNRPRYKRLTRGLTVARAREIRAEAFDDLVSRLLHDLGPQVPPLDLRSHPIVAQLVEVPSPLLDTPYKHREDLLDAVLCAWTAALWHRFPHRVQILGADDLPDAAGIRPTIVAPARPEQRVDGRPMR